MGLEANLIKNHRKSFTVINAEIYQTWPLLSTFETNKKRAYSHQELLAGCEAG